MINLLAETIEAIVDSGHQIEDVTFIGSADRKYLVPTWERFTVLADREYDDGYGGAEVATDLIIEFADGRKMWRGEYDGSEWWMYDPPPATFDGEPTLVERLVGHSWPTLKELHTKADAEHNWRAEDRPAPGIVEG